VLVEDLDDLRKIQQGAGEAINLIDNYDINPAGFNVGEQPLQGRALQRSA
jgi:hypothetical protein